MLYFLHHRGEFYRKEGSNTPIGMLKKGNKGDFIKQSKWVYIYKEFK